MANYTWVSNTNPGDQTSRIWLRNRTLLYQIGSYANLTTDEYAQLSQDRTLVAGTEGSPAYDVVDELASNPVLIAAATAAIANKTVVTAVRPGETPGNVGAEMVFGNDGLDTINLDGTEQ
jgi:hypothetical protein